MGYALVYGICGGCGIYMVFNPTKVPSFRFKGPDAPKEPICRDCMDYINGERAKKGLPPFPVDPDAYPSFQKVESQSSPPTSPLLLQHSESHRLAAGQQLVNLSKRSVRSMAGSGHTA